MTTTPNFHIKKALMASGKSQRELSFATRIPESKVSGIVRGYLTPTIKEKIAIANFLNLEEAELFGGGPHE